jgi:hypothetical protein
MKIAICISGYLRTFKDCYLNILDNVIQGHDYDLFIHTYDKLGNSQGFQFEIDVNKDIDLEYLKNLKNLKGLVVEKYDDIKYLFENKIKLLYHDPNRFLSMLYKIYQCNELKKKYEIDNDFIYDLVVRTRGDLIFSNKINLNVKNININSYAWNGISEFENSYLYNDQFAIGSSEIMDYYSRLYLDIEIIDGDGPEIIMKNHLKNVIVDKQNFNFNIKRR